MKKLLHLCFVIIFIFSFTLAGCSRQVVVNDIEEPSPEQQDISLQQPRQPTIECVQNEDNVLSNNTFNWYFLRNKEHKTPEINNELNFTLSDYDAYYVGSKEKVIFLTFDEGYENGYTSQILDILKANQVTAAFFATAPYVKGNPDLVKRMVAEGHMVGNHSKTHPSMPAKTGNTEEFKQEITDVAAAYKDIIGKEMPKFFRPPRGEYSEKSLQMTKDLGYQTIFWSFAYQDWLTDNQPDPEPSYERIMQGTHNGEIMLLHAVSSTNTQILDKVLKDIKKEGYRFAPLTELENI